MNLFHIVVILLGILLGIFGCRMFKGFVSFASFVFGAFFGIIVGLHMIDSTYSKLQIVFVVAGCTFVGSMIVWILSIKILAVGIFIQTYFCLDFLIVQKEWASITKSLDKKNSALALQQVVKDSLKDYAGMFVLAFIGAIGLTVAAVLFYYQVVSLLTGLTGGLMISYTVLGSLQFDSVFAKILVGLLLGMIFATIQWLRYLKWDETEIENADSSRRREPKVDFLKRNRAQYKIASRPGRDQGIHLGYRAMLRQVQALEDADEEEDN